MIHDAIVNKVLAALLDTNIGRDWRPVLAGLCAGRGGEVPPSTKHPALPGNHRHIGRMSALYRNKARRLDQKRLEMVTGRVG